MKPPKINKWVWIIRIDPETRAIAKIKLPAGKTPTDVHAKRVCKAEKVGMREILRMTEETTLCVFGGLDLEPPQASFRFAGTDDTMGISFLGGKGPGGGLVDVPVNVEWVRKRIEWTRTEREEEDDNAADAQGK